MCLLLLLSSPLKWSSVIVVLVFNSSLNGFVPTPPMSLSVYVMEMGKSD